ncbi:PEP-CTERM sorting domain-containing protein [Omnitrophica bacterium]|nr:PEP-CTERM sorting domain-containing protein [Candidatus Omnitrophota bacterium]
MKKTLLVLTMLAVVFAFGITPAFAAVPVINGSYQNAVSDAPLGVGEWLNDSDPTASIIPYPYYLHVTDPNEAGVPDAYDISAATLLQELGGNIADDGIYLAIQTYAAATLSKINTNDDKPRVILQADFNADGLPDIKFTHSTNNSGVQTLTWERELGSVLGVPVDPTPFGLEGVNYKLAGNNVIEYFFPTGLGGTPHVPFPGQFIGTILYDNGGQAPDDIVIGTLIPEPGTMFLFGAGLLGLIGLGRRKS